MVSNSSLTCHEQPRPLFVYFHWKSHGLAMAHTFATSYDSIEHTARLSSQTSAHTCVRSLACNCNATPADLHQASTVVSSVYSVAAGTRQDAALTVSLAQGAMTSKWLPKLCVCVPSDAVLCMSMHALLASHLTILISLMSFSQLVVSHRQREAHSCC